MIPGPGCFLLCYFVEKQKEKNLISQKYFISVYRPSGILFMQKQTFFFFFCFGTQERPLIELYTLKGICWEEASQQRTSKRQWDKSKK